VVTQRGSQDAIGAADAAQAAYFRSELAAVRDQLTDTVRTWRALIERRGYANRLRADVHDAETQIRYLEKMIARLDRRFAGR
jgi:hypothetical protein